VAFGVHGARDIACAWSEIAWTTPLLIIKLGACLGLAVIPVHKSSVASRFCFSVMQPESRCVHVTCIIQVTYTIIQVTCAYSLYVRGGPRNRW
jgi:hypothetical protein